MTVPTLPGVMRVSVEMDVYSDGTSHTVFAKRIANVWHVERGESASWTDTDRTNVLEVFGGWATDEFAALIPEDTVVRECKAQIYNGAGSPVETLTVDADGAQGSNHAPLNTCYTVGMRQALSSRRRRGRKRFGPIPLGQLDSSKDDYVQSSWAAEVLAACDILQADIQGYSSSSGLTVYSRVANVSYPITEFFSDTLRVTTIRKRIRGAVS